MVMTEFDVKRMALDAEKGIKKFGLEKHTNAFLESEEVKKSIKQAFDEIRKKMLVFVEKAPESLKDSAKEILEDWDAKELAFEKDIHLNFKNFLWEDLSMVPECILQQITELGLIVKFFGYEGEIAFEILQDILDEGIEVMPSYYLGCLYEDYVPEGMPEEVVNLLKTMFNGQALIPINAIFPEWDSSDESESEE